MLGRGLVVFAAVAVVSLAGCQRNVSGYYVATDNGVAIWLQVARAQDQRLTGELEANVLRPDGSVEQNSAAITGDVDGENVTIRGSRLFGLESFVLSGAQNGDVLTLTGEKSVPRTFVRCSPAAFQTKVAELRVRSQSILREKAGTRLNP